MQSKLVNADYKDIHEEHMQALFNGPSGEFEMFSGQSLWQLRHSVSVTQTYKSGMLLRKICALKTHTNPRSRFAHISQFLN